MTNFQMLGMRNKTVAEVLADCWRVAEERTITRCKGASEEEITFCFRLEFGEIVEAASRKGTFEKAFFRDLKLSFPQFNAAALESVARGLIAAVNFHQRPHEGHVSGSDLGIVLSRPKIRMIGTMGDELSIQRDSQRALLAQAKLGEPKGDRYLWRTLTKPQHRLVPPHVNYFALLLYRHADSQASRLLPFSWQLCHGYTVADAEQWLKMDSFPDELNSSAIIQRLATETIGTDDPTVIADVIDPQKSEKMYLEIRLFWRPGAEPPNRVKDWLATQANRLFNSR